MREAENVVQADLRSKDSILGVYVAKVHAYNQDEHEEHVAHGGHHLGSPRPLILREQGGDGRKGKEAESQCVTWL